MKKAVREICILLLCLFVFSGCGAKQQSSEQGDVSELKPPAFKEDASEDVLDGMEKQNEVMSTSFPDHYYYSGEKLDIDVELDYENISFKKAVIELAEYDFVELADSLIPADEAEMIGDNTHYIEASKKDDASCGYSYSKTYFGYSTYAYYKIGKSVRMSEADDAYGYYNLTKYSDKRDFSFGSEKECEDAVRKLLKKTGVSTENLVPNVYYLDHKIMAEEERYYSDNDEFVYENRFEWTEDDDTYLFFFHQKYCGLDVLPSYRQSGVDADEQACPVIAAYGKSGLVFLKIEMPVIKSGNGCYVLKDFEDVAETLKKRYEYPIDDCTYSISKAKLICDTDENYNARPVWAFVIKECFKDGRISVYTVKVDAVTGDLWYR